jgi:hypothetical protein
MERTSRPPPSDGPSPRGEYSTPIVKTLLGFFKSDLRTGAVPNVAVVAEEKIVVVVDVVGEPNGVVTEDARFEGFVKKASECFMVKTIPAMAVDTFQRREKEADVVVLRKPIVGLSFLMRSLLVVCCAFQLPC